MVKCLVRDSYNIFLEKKYTIRFLLVGIGIIILVTCGLYFYKKDSADGRLLIFRSVIPMIVEKPLLGFGFEGFSKEYMIRQACFLNKQKDNSLKMKADETQFAFNELLRLQLERGLVGVISVIGLLGFIVSRSPQQKYMREIFILRGMFVCLCIFSMVSYPLSDFTIQAYGVFLLAAIISCSKDDRKIYDLNRKRNVALVVIVLCIGLFLFPYFQAHETAFKKWHVTLGDYTYNSSDALNKLAKMHQKLNYDFMFLFTYGKLLNHSDRFEEAVSILQESYKRRSSYMALIEMGKSYVGMQQYDNAAKCWELAGQMIPNRFLPGLLAADMYGCIGDKAKATEIARKTLAKNIKINSPEVRLIIRQLKKHLPSTLNNQN